MRTILHIDDDTDDCEMLQSALLHAEPTLHYHAVSNGLEGIQYLQTAQSTGELPCLIVLDINMPFLDGKKTLEHIQGDLGMKNVPVIILTSSSNPHDASFFASKARELITKPSHPRDVDAIAQRLVTYCNGRLES